VDVVFSTNYSYQSQQWSDFATCTTVYCPTGGENPYLRLHAYGLWNGSIAVGDREGRITVTGLVKNILDKSYSTFNQTGGPGGSILYFIPRDADRYYGIQLHMKFGQ
jgi:iron complex outermembrane receptor protein